MPCAPSIEGSLPAFSGIGTFLSGSIYVLAILSSGSCLGCNSTNEALLPKHYRYEQLKRFFTQNGSRQLDTPTRLLSGALAGICSVTVTYPLDLVRARLSIASASFARVDSGGSAALNAQPKVPGIWEMSLKVMREEGGFKALYRGLVPTALGVAPYVGINFASYEFFRGIITPPEKTTVPRKLLCGALAGSISQTLTYPLDVLRRKVQLATCKG